MKTLFVTILLILFPIGLMFAQKRPPIVDMHVHAWNAVQAGPEHPQNKASLQQYLSNADSFNVVLFLASGPQDFLKSWKETAGERMVAGPMFPCYEGLTPNDGRRPCFNTGSVFPDPNWLQMKYETGEYGVMGELINPYAGIRYDDKRMWEYYEMADSLAIPIAVHFRGAPPQTAHNCCPEFRLTYGDPFVLEKILVRYPNIRLHVMHGHVLANPNLLLLLQQYPNVYVDLTPFHLAIPREGFHEMLRSYKRNGLLDRIMFGTDGTPLEQSIQAFESVPFLTENELSGIFCENASRFLNRPQLCK